MSGPTEGREALGAQQWERVWADVAAQLSGYRDVGLEIDERREHRQRRRALDTYNALIAERRLYAYDRFATGRNGAVRFRCPGASGKLRTTGCRHSVGLPLDVPASEHPAGMKTPTACEQSTIQIRADVEEKVRQRLYWGSPEWQKSYARRSTVERTFGQLKGRSLQRGWIRLTGRSKPLLLIAVAVLVNNLVSLRNWALETGNHPDPVTTRDIRDHGFEEYDAAGTLHGDAPPVPAPPPA